MTEPKNPIKHIKLLGYIKISGEIEALTGLHIGGTADSIDKGGIDNPVIKNPVTNEPYIPGSSLRGRMRSLLEKKTAQALHPMTKEIWMEMYDQNAEKYKSDKEKSTIDALSSQVCRVFGNSASYESIPSILIVRDALLSKKNTENYCRENYIKNGLPVTEAKLEIAVDRITAHAMPRTIERVPAGAQFSFEIIYKIQTASFTSPVDENGKPTDALLHQINGTENIKEDIDNILWALAQIEKYDGLGGNTSRGHGQVKFIFNSFSHEIFDQRQKEAIEKVINELNLPKVA